MISFDVLDRIIQIKYNGVVRYNYSYNGNGDLCRVEGVLNDLPITMNMSVWIVCILLT